MSSSIFSSDQAGAKVWGSWLRLLMAVMFGGMLALYFAVVALDPFSTGRFTIVDDNSVATRLRAFANAGRVRDPQFDSAIIGNSIALRFDPVLLSEVTGSRVVQLSIVGTRFEEQLAQARAFARFHRGPKLLVWSIDHVWCGHAGSGDAFPYWLYQSDDLTYLRRIFSLDSVSAAFAKFTSQYLGAKPKGSRDGRREGNGAPPQHLQRIARQHMLTDIGPAAAGHFQPQLAAFDELEAFTSGLPHETAVVLVLPPFHRSLLPRPGSPAEQSLDVCKARVQAIAAKRPRTAVVDWLKDAPLVRDPDNFWDALHLKDHVADALVADIGQAVQRLNPTPAR